MKIRDIIKENDRKNIGSKARLERANKTIARYKQIVLNALYDPLTKKYRTISGDVRLRYSETHDDAVLHHFSIIVLPKFLWFGKKLRVCRDYSVYDSNPIFEANLLEYLASNEI